MAPWGKSENWTLSVQHSEADVRRYVDNFEQLGRASRMKAVVFEEHGGPDVLQYTDIPDPEPKPFEVLIEVKAAGANFNDIWARRGMPGMKVIFPHVAGSDVAGVVRAVGADVGGRASAPRRSRWATRSSSTPASPAARARCARRARSSSAASS